MTILTREQLESVLDEAKVISCSPAELQALVRCTLDHDAALRAEVERLKQELTTARADAQWAAKRLIRELDCYYFWQAPYNNSEIYQRAKRIVESTK